MSPCVCPHASATPLASGKNLASVILGALDYWRGCNRVGRLRWPAHRSSSYSIARFILTSAAGQ